MNYQNKRSFGNSPRGGFNRGGGSRPNNEGFKARCADCGNDCTVPFKPNGRKPVLCSDCFRGESRDNSRRFDSQDRKPFKRSFDKPKFDRKPNNDGMKKELNQIQNKLDHILRILQEVTIEEVDE